MSTVKCWSCRTVNDVKDTTPILLDCVECNKRGVIPLGKVIPGRIERENKAFLNEHKDNLLKTITDQVEERYKSEKEALEKEKEALEKEKEAMNRENEVHSKNKELLETERQLFEEEKKRFGEFTKSLTEKSLNEIRDRLKALEEGNGVLNEKFDRLKNEGEELNKAKELFEEDKKSLLLEKQQIVEDQERILKMVTETVNERTEKDVDKAQELLDEEKKKFGEYIKSLTEANEAVSQTHKRLLEHENELMTGMEKMEQAKRVFWDSITPLSQQNDSKIFSDKVDDDFSQLQDDFSSFEKSLKAMGAKYMKINLSVNGMNPSDENKKMIYNDVKKRLEKIETYMTILSVDMEAASTLLANAMRGEKEELSNDSEA